MPAQVQVETTGTTPSITSWTRLEPSTRDALMQKSLEAQVRDPLWFLARQFQMGEFLGVDAGSPLRSSILAEFQNITTYRPGDDDSSTQQIDPNLPVEIHVERESVALRLRGAVQLGRYFEKLVRGSGVAQPDQIIQQFRLAFPIPSDVPDMELASPDAVRLRSIVCVKKDAQGNPVPGGVVNGVDLYPSAFACVNGTTPPVPIPGGCNAPGLAQVLKDFVSYRQGLFSEPAGDTAWQPPKLNYDFALGSPTDKQSLLLAGQDFGGGYLDWYSFSLGTASANQVSSQNPATICPQPFDFLPHHVVFRGMPDSRWWNFEDGATDFGQLAPDHVDLPKLLVMEFALIYGNDWFLVPIPVPLGVPTKSGSVQASLSRISALVVTDSFGVRTFIRPAEETSVTPGGSSWSMYKVSGQNARSDFILTAPTLGHVQDAAAIEDVLFLRDDMAAMAWAVEKQLHGDLDLPVDAYQTFLQSGPAQDPTPTRTPGGPDIFYTAEKLPPYNWVPLVPVLSNQGSPFLRRGVLEVPDPSSPSGLRKLPAHAEVLEPGQPFFVVDHAVPRAGQRVTRYFRFTRSFYGDNYLWLARKSGLGRGQGWSGLRFDLARNIPDKPTS
jgi:hypothetical protein